MKPRIAPLALSLFATLSLAASVDAQSLTTQRIASGLNQPLWAGAPAGDDRVFIAEKAGVVPLVSLLRTGSPGSRQQAASCLTELALVSSNRDVIANAGGIEATIKLLSSSTIGTAEVAARVLAHLAYDDEEAAGSV